MIPLPQKVPIIDGQKNWIMNGRIGMIIGIESFTGVYSTPAVSGNNRNA